MVGTPTDHSCVTQAGGASLADSSGRPVPDAVAEPPHVAALGVDAGVQQPTCRRSRLLRRCLRMLPLFSFLHRLLRGGSGGMCPSYDPRPSGRQGGAKALQRASRVRRAHPSLRTQPLRERRTREAQILPELDVRDLPHPRSLIDPRSGNSKPGHHLVQGDQICELVCSAGVLDGQERYLLLLGGPARHRSMLEGLTSVSATATCRTPMPSTGAELERATVRGPLPPSRAAELRACPLHAPSHHEPGLSLEPSPVDHASRRCHAR